MEGLRLLEKGGNDMIKTINMIVNIELEVITISCKDKSVSVKLQEKLINSKDFYEMIDYNIDDVFNFAQEKYEIPNEISDKEKELYRLANYCVDLISQTVNAINKKSIELRGNIS